MNNLRKKTRLNYLLVLISIVLILNLSGCGSNEPIDYLYESNEDKDARMSWWREAGFGMFIHWGLYAVPAGVYKGEARYAEWIMTQADIPVEEYEKYADQFNPVKFNADEWVKLAKNAGMKYIVITSKHHDGFCLWDSKVSDYDIIDRAPYKVDILKELSKACKKEGIKLCFYHSIMDWHHPDATGENFEKYREEYLKPQLKELTSGYGDIGVLWFDGEWIGEWTESQGRDLYNYVRNLKPDIIINNRVGKGRDGMQGMNKYFNAAGDFGTPEQEILEGAAKIDWESCMTMNDHWGFSSYDNNFKSTKTLIHNLIDIAAKGGNYLLNVGPTAEGLIPGESVERLKEMGDWMNVNAEVIHNSGSIKNYKETENLYYTTSGDGEFIYAILVEWPGESLQLRYVKPETGSEITMLGYDQPFLWTISEKEGVVIEIPAELQEESNRSCKYAWVFKIKGTAAIVADIPVITTDKNQTADKVLFTGSVQVSLSTETEETTIYYTMDGSIPDFNSEKYADQVTISESKTIQAFASGVGLINSHISTTEFVKITAFKEIKYKIPFSPKYPAMGELTLINGELGSDYYNDKQWLGWEGEDLEVICELEAPKNIRKIQTRFLQNIDSWIFLPEKVEFALSSDGINFTPLMGMKNTVSDKKEGEFVETFASDGGNISARYIKVMAKNIGICPDWHKGAGSKSWIFIDEIIIE